MSRIVFVALIISLFTQCSVFAQQGPPEKVTTQRALKISDADDWQRVSQFQVSPDGQWAVWVLMPTEGDGHLFVKRADAAAAAAADKTTDETQDEQTSEDEDKEEEGEDKEEASKQQHEFEVGPGSGQIQFSHDSKFVVFRQSPKDKEAKAARKSGNPLQGKAVLLNLETGEKVEFEKVQRFSFAGENSSCLAVQKNKPKGRPDGDKGWDGTDLVIHSLDSQSQINIGNVKAFAFNKAGSQLAIVIDAEGRTGNGLQLFHVDDNRIETLENGDATYRSLSWTREGDALALLKSKKDDDYENPHHHLLAFSDIGGARQAKVVVDPTKHGAIPEDMTISPNRAPEWSEDRQMIFFGIHALKGKDKKGDKDKESGDKKDDAESKKKPKSADDEQAGLVIWHWQDPRMQSMQQVQESRDKNQSDLCVFHVADEKAVRLADEEIPQVTVTRPHRFAIGTDNRNYERFGNLEGTSYRDVYSIDLETDKRKLILEKAQYVLNVSPDGTRLLYYKNDDGQFYVYDMVKGAHTNITKDVDASFINVEDDHNLENPPRRSWGWSTDSDYVLLSDGWDIWKVAANGDGGTNLTVDGTEKQIRYRSPARFDPDVTGIDLSEAVYVAAYGEWTKKAGFARIDSDNPGVEMLVWQDASFGGLRKLEDHDIYMYARATHSDSNDFFVGGPDLEDARQMTVSNQQQANFKWSDGVRLVDYTNSDGVKLQGALHLPTGYIEGKKYPTIVYMYEKLSQNANRYDTPRVGGFSASIYTSNGYAVFNPDIVFKVNDPGTSSVDCILAGLDAAIETGVVDSDRVGIHGHSWGGYQTAFMITQSNRFKAAVAGAPLTNMISMYSSIYWNSGSANQPIFERSQGRFESGYWDNLEAYARNSPVYYAKNVNTPLLLLHNDKDGAVDWNQGIEYFNTLRRLDKPVVMLQYTGENHGLRQPANRKDYSYRMMDFFNHYLKEQDAPTWWSEGIKHLEMKDHIKDYKKSKTD